MKPLLLCAVFLSGCGTFSAAGTATVPPAAGFEPFEVDLGPVRHPTVLTGFLLDQPFADLAVVHVGKHDVPRLRILSYGETGWAPRLEADLRPDVAFVDLATIGGRDRLITYDGARVSWFDPDTAGERVLADFAVAYNPRDDLQGSPAQAGGKPPRVDITRDLNRDGRDDLVIPDVDGFRIALQMESGSFTEPVLIGPPEPFADAALGNLDAGGPGAPAARTYGELGITAATIPVYLSRIHEIDYDRDGRHDLAFWQGDRFDVHLQDAAGRFSPAAIEFAPGVPLDADGAYARAFEYSDQGVFSVLFGTGEKSRQTVLHSVRDLDGDRIADLVTLTFTGRSIARQRSEYGIHLGKPAPGATAFAPRPDTTIRPRGRAGAMQPWGYASQLFGDFNGDGQVDVLFREVKVGMGGMTRALFGKSVPVDLALYLMQEGAYPETPSARVKVRRFAPFGGSGVFFPPVLVGDVTGDGRADLLVGDSPEALHVYPGAAGAHFPARAPRKVVVSLPGDERNTRLADLNGDGRQDLLVLRAPGEREPAAPYRVTLLIAL